MPKNSNVMKLKRQQLVIARRIARKLFTSWLDRRAERLVLEIHGTPIREGDGGGWCRQAVVDVIYEELRRA